ncbi:DUF4232 domain-containing protein [Streptomyces sp. NPDC005573]|uniref:DUF4232 domain-containing protein n=1 Tax=Streptomyces sp. NPDC005573 TaxID=3156890 RepID=UPI0033A48DC7
MAYSSRSTRRGVLLTGAVAVLGLLSACGDGHDVSAEPAKRVTGTAAPAAESPQGSTPSASAAATAPSGRTPSSGAAQAASPRATGTGATSGTGAKPAASTRCHTSELRASVGRNDPGAGQENFPVVLTNRSGRVCTLHGFPGAAFVNGSGGQLGADPKRSSGAPVTVTLRPGQSAWAGLTFSNPEISGAKAATPASLLITPPDERDHLKVTWAAGTVPVSGNSSSVFLTVFRPGTGP